MVDDSGFVVEQARRIPVAHAVDVIVAGGGPAGIAAGVAAARAGASVLIVDRYGYLGGMVTGAHVIWVLGVGDGEQPMARGIVEDLRVRLEAVDGIVRYGRCGDYAVDPETFKWQAAEALTEAGARILLHTLACAPIVDHGRVVGVFTESKSGRQAIVARAVIDCTADGDLAARAGCGCDNETHDISLGLDVQGVDTEAVRTFADAHPERYREIEAHARELNGGHMLAGGRRIPGVDITDAAALSQAECELRREYFRALTFLRTNLPGWENARISQTLPQLGVRQSRRIHGGYQVTNHDLHSSRHFSDGIARLGACMAGYKLYDPPGRDYDIPYRCLVPRDVDGLLVAGRCLDADYLATNTLRLIVPCLVTGQAAGAAAALAVAAGTAPRDVDMASLRAELRRQNVYLGDGTVPLPPAAGPAATNTPTQDQ